MVYIENPVPAKIVRKMNRFLCRVLTGKGETSAHIPNSGRLTELLTPGAQALLEPSTNPERKTRYTLRSVKYGGRWVCVDSSVPNRVAERMVESGKWTMFAGYRVKRREATIGHHRFDLLLEGAGKKPMIVEVKSATLVNGDTAMFPDAPTERGKSHVEYLAELLDEGYDCAVLFVIGRSGVARFTPNAATDPGFAASLKAAWLAGVKVMAVTCAVGERTIHAAVEIPVAWDG
ncbi:MAG: DNA/RNA nuclease SfsA [Nitrospinae bacterium]|nr:DNA/RNA nuclease SfsA [Nitrospinota bacterium]